MRVHRVRRLKTQKDQKMKIILTRDEIKDAIEAKLRGMGIPFKSIEMALTQSSATVSVITDESGAEITEALDESLDIESAQHDSVESGFTETIKGTDEPQLYDDKPEDTSDTEFKMPVDPRKAAKVAGDMPSENECATPSTTGFGQ